MFVENPHWLNTWLEIRWDEGIGGVTPLHIAARYGLSDWVRHQLTVPGAAVDPVDVNGRSPLFWAAECGTKDIVKTLIDAGANPDQDEHEGLRPLHRAALMNHAGVVKVLLEAGVNPLTPKTKENSGSWCGNASRTRGHTPLMVSPAWLCLCTAEERFAV